MAVVLIGAYRTLGTNFMGGCCRFEPSCSEYALKCFHQFSFFTALKLTVRRLVRCRPFGSFGFDPVPLCHKSERVDNATR